MGICYSRLERQEVVARCKARRRYMKQLAKARQAFFDAHMSYLRSLRGAGAALFQYANIVSDLQPQHHLPPCPPSPPPPSSPSVDLVSTLLSSPESATTGEECQSATTTSDADSAGEASPSVPSEQSKAAAGESCKEDSTSVKDIAEILKEINEYFLKAADSGSHVSMLIADPSSISPNHRTKNKVHNYGRSLSPMMHSCGWDSELDGASEILKTTEEIIGGDAIGVVKESHRATIERLYSMEKKLHQEAKMAESMKLQHERRASQLKKQEANGADHVITETTKKEIEKLESKMMVASQAMEATSEEIIRSREEELYPQLLELMRGLTCMWRNMNECHQAQANAVQQHRLHIQNNNVSEQETTPKARFKSTLKLEFEIQQWHSALCNLIKTHREYMCSLTGWLRLSLFQLNHYNKPNKTQQSPSSIYSLSEEWQLVLDRVPDKVASEGIKSFLRVVHAFALQQEEEQRKKKRLETEFKEIEHKVAAVQSLESKYNQHTIENSSSLKLRKMIAEKRVEVESLRAKAKEEKTKHDKYVSTMKESTLDNLKTELPNMFQAMISFSNLHMEEFRSVYEKLQSTSQ